MNVHQYFALGVMLIASVGTPLMLAKAIHRKQKQRVFEIIVLDLALVYCAVETAFPAVKVSAPQIMDWAFTILSLLMGINAVMYYERYKKIFAPGKTK